MKGCVRICNNNVLALFCIQDCRRQVIEHLINLSEIDYIASKDELSDRSFSTGYMLSLKKGQYNAAVKHVKSLLRSAAHSGPYRNFTYRKIS